MFSTRAGKEKKQRKNDTAWFYNIWLQYIFAIYCIFYITTLRYCIDAGMPNMDILINKLKHNKKKRAQLAWKKATFLQSFSDRLSKVCK